MVFLLHLLLYGVFSLAVVQARLQDEGQTADGKLHEEGLKPSTLYPSLTDGPVVEEPLYIAAFNVRRFGQAKMNKPEVVDILAKIIRRYDILLIQEVVDSSGTAVLELKDVVNSWDGPSYEVEISPRLGRSSAREQYAFFHRPDRVSIQQTKVYDESGTDVFIREPFIVQFSTPKTRGLDQVTVVSIHTQPKEAVKEVDALADVYDWAVENMKAKNVIIMGDFNAGGSYVKGSDWDDIRLWTRPEFQWLIPNHMDTTSTNSNCAYDRFVISGDELKQAVVYKSAKVFRYDEEYKVEQSLLLDVSDHFPIEVKLKPKVSHSAREHLDTFVDVTVVDNWKVQSAGLMEQLAEKSSVGKFDVLPFFKKEGKLARIELESKQPFSADVTLDAIEDFRTQYPGFISEDAFRTLQYKVQHGALVDNSVYDDIASPRFLVDVMCNAINLQCAVTVHKQTSIG